MTRRDPYARRSEVEGRAEVGGRAEAGEAAALGGDGLGRVVARGGINEAGAFLPPGAVELDMGGLTPILSPSVSPIEEWRDVTPMLSCPYALTPMLWQRSTGGAPL